jgi:tetratricopeptide (TPR) repeat protein
MNQGKVRSGFSNPIGKGSLLDSEETIRKALQENPDDLSLKIRLADFYLRKHRLTETRILVEEVLSLDPQHHEALSLLGDLFMKDRIFERAIDCYRQAYGKAPNDYLVLKTARAFKEMKRYDDALQELEKVLVVKPRHFTFLREKALLLLRMNRQTEALETFEKARVIRPDDAYVQKEILRLRSVDKSNEQTIAEIRRMTSMPSKKDDPQLHGLLADKLENAGQIREAAAEYKIASDLQPDNVFFLKKQGYCYYHEKDYDQALRCLAEAFRRNPSDFYVRGTVKKIYEIRGDLGGFLRLLEEVLKRHPHEKTLYGAIKKVRKELEVLSSVPQEP